MKVVTSKRRNGRQGLWFWSTSIGILVLSCGVLLIIILVPMALPRDNSEPVFCSPNGTLQFGLESYLAYAGTYSIDPINDIYLDEAQADYLLQLWDPALFLTITLGFGKLTLSQAKAISIMWDLLIGRGSQLLLIQITYPLIRKSLSLAMESSPASFSLYRAIVFQGISIPTICEVGARTTRHRSGALRQLRNGNATWIYATLFVIMGYILLCPTFLSALAGYQAALTPYVHSLTDPGALIPLQNMTALSPYQWILHDGSRIGMTDSTMIDGNLTASEYNFWVDTFLPRYFAGFPLPDCWDGYSGAALSFPSSDSYNTTNYTGCTGCTDCTPSGITLLATLNSIATLGQEEGNGALCGQNTTPPRLQYIYNPGNNISLFVPLNATSVDQVSTNINLFGQNFTVPAPPLNITYNDHAAFTSGNETYNTTYLSDPNNFVCIPGGTYQWGFSYLMLVTFVSVTVVFVAMLVTLQGLVHHYSRLDQFEQPISIYRDILDMADELRCHFGDEIEDIPGDELHKVVEESDNVIRLQTSTLPLSRAYEARARRAAQLHHKTGGRAEKSGSDWDGKSYAEREAVEEEGDDSSEKLSFLESLLWSQRRV